MRKRILISILFMSCIYVCIAQNDFNDLLKKGIEHHENGLYFSANSLFNEIDLDKAAPDFKTEYWTKYSEFLIDWESFEKADSLLKLAHKNQLAVDSTHQLFHQIVVNSGHLKIEQKNYIEAEQILLKTIQNPNQLSNKTRIKINYLLGELYLETDQLEKSATYLEKAFKNHQTYCPEEVKSLAIIYNHKSRLLSAKSEFQKALTLNNQALATILNKGKNHPNYLRILYNQAALHLQLEDFAKAEEQFQFIKNHYQSLYKNKPRHIETLGQLGILAEETGYFQKAENYYQKVITFFENQNLNSFVIYSNRLAILLEEKLKKEKEAAIIYQNAKKVWEKKRSKKNEIYASLANNLAEYYEVTNQLEKADTLYQEAKAILAEIAGKYDYGYASVVYNLAFLQKKLGKNKLAEQYFLEVAEIDKATIGTHHPDYISYTLMTLANFYDEQIEVNKAISYFKEANQGQLELIKNYYATFDEQTRLNFLKEATHNFNDYFSFLHRRRQQKLSFTEAQNISLQIKGLALDYFQSNRTKALTTQDTLLKSHYEAYQKARKALSQAYGLSKEEHQAANINLLELKEKVSQSEKKVTRKAKALDLTMVNNATLDQLQQQLKTREVAIDFVEFEYSNFEETTDTTYYYALVTQKDQTSPYFLPLCTQKDLQEILQLSAQYGAGYTKYPEIGQKLYELVWQPLEPYLEDVHTIHLSPTGLLHKVAFGGLPYQEGQLLDQYNIRYYGSLRDFINAQPTEIPKSIALAGGAYFDIDSTDLVKIAEEAEELAFVKFDSIDASATVATVSRAIANDSTRNAIEFNYLPGTKKEVEQLAAAFKKQSWQTITYLGEKASEDNIKMLNGVNAPGILHLATHGFFFDPYDTETQAALSDETLRERIIGAESPLLRSGLVFSGVNHSWKGGKPIKGLEDGVLTAFEIANMELGNTELVVLSACETGLGDVDSAEGVFGLQRAFKAAGVDRLLISLWKIPDTQTAELMQLFYHNYLSGMPLAKALRQAQLTMSEQYGPFYWAGFILVE